MQNKYIKRGHCDLLMAVEVNDFFTKLYIKFKKYKSCI